MDIVHENDERLLGRKPLEELSCAPVDLVERELVLRKADGGGHAAGDVGRARYEGPKFLERELRRVGGVERR